MKTESTQEVRNEVEKIIENNELKSDSLRILADCELLLVGGGGADVVFG
jgi:hypothetical protein